MSGLPKAPDSRKDYPLLDSRIVSETSGVSLVPGRVEKDPDNPLLAEDKPWEPRFDNVYPTVLFDEEEGLYKLWYNTFIVDPHSSSTLRKQRLKKPYVVGDREMGLCYAISKDGKSWHKPELGVVEFEGSSQNNIVMRNVHGTGVFKDLRDPNPEHRYKAFMQNGVAFSPDGVHWSPFRPQLGIGARGDTHNNIVFDVRSGEYVGITRLWEDDERVVGLTRTPDFEHWTKSTVVLRRNRGHQTYSMPIVAYRDIFLGLASIFHVEEDTVDCEWTWSPDGMNWYFLTPERPAIPRGPEGSPDSHCIFAAAPLFTDRGVLMYYGGCNGCHSGWRDGFVSLARLEKDRIAGYSCDDKSEIGIIITEPIECAGKRLLLNADAGSGSLKILLREEESREWESQPIESDLMDGEVEWKGGRDLSSLKGRSIRLEFELKNAVLYSFSFSD